MRQKIFGMLTMLAIVMVMVGCEQAKTPSSEELEEKMATLEMRVSGLTNEIRNFETSLNNLKRDVNTHLERLDVVLSNLKALEEGLRASLEQVKTEKELIAKAPQGWPFGVQLALILVIIILVVFLFKLRQTRAREGEGLEGLGPPEVELPIPKLPPEGEEAKKSGPAESPPTEE